MKRQKNTTQMKEQTRNTEVQINEEKIGKLPEKEFRIMIVKMIKKKNLITKWKQCKSIPFCPHPFHRLLLVSFLMMAILTGVR